MTSTYLTVGLVSVLVLTVAGNPGGHGYGGYGGYGHGYGGDFYAYPRFQYNYGVQDKLTGDFKTAHEVRDGDLTKGSYSLLQPDGVLRTVNYVVDPIGGFQAQVLNKGLAVHVPYGHGKGFIGHGYGGYGPGPGPVGHVGHYGHGYGYHG